MGEENMTICVCEVHRENLKASFSAHTEAEARRQGWRWALSNRCHGFRLRVYWNLKASER